jgi:glycosyltransferase involved in cell wall biosynthesis
VLLAAGTKAHQKGFDRLIPIFVALARRDPQLRLVLLGLSAEPYHGRDQQAWLRQRLACLDSTLQSRLVMPGAVGNMAAWYARASLFVLPSRYEGFPNVLLEAMAAGCACVASDCATGPRDLITDHVSGLLLPPQASTEQWVSALAALLEDHPRRRRLGMAAQAVRRRFDPERLRCDFLEALSRIHNG